MLLGFTRVEAPDPDADEQPNVVALSKGKQERWLPAAEVNGEGIFIEFNKDTLAAWLNSPAVKGLSQNTPIPIENFVNPRDGQSRS